MFTWHVANALLRTANISISLSRSSSHLLNVRTREAGSSVTREDLHGIFRFMLGVRALSSSVSLHLSCFPWELSLFNTACR